MIKVSVIIPVYNLEKYITRCLESIINQTFKEIEILVVNDGSTDKSLDLIKEKALLDNRIIIINKDNEGISKARLSGYEKAKGEYILFVDGDDYVDKNAIEILYNTAKSNDYDIVQYKYLINYEDGIKGRNDRVLIDEKKFINKDLIKLNLLGDTIFSIWSKFIKKDFLVKNNINLPQNISYAEDVALTCVLSIYKPKFVFIDKYLYIYNKRNNSASHKVSDNLLDIKDAMKYIKFHLNKNDLYLKYKAEYEYLVYMQSYFYRMDDMFSTNNIRLGKKIFKQWKQMNININEKNNIYYKKLYDNKKAIFIANICKKSYYISYLYYRLKKKVC